MSGTVRALPYCGAHKLTDRSWKADEMGGPLGEFRDPCTDCFGNSEARDGDTVVYTIGGNGDHYHAPAAGAREYAGVNVVADNDQGEWPLRAVEDADYYGIHGSWLDAPSAFDAERAGDNPRVYAVSVATPDADTVRVRYAAVNVQRVTVRDFDGVLRDNGAVVPVGLTTRDGWPRSYVPAGPHPPDGVRRRAESEHLLSLWSDRRDEIPDWDEWRQSGVDLAQMGDLTLGRSGGDA